MLQIVLTDGAVLDLGRVIGANGRDGIQGVRGSAGPQGEPGEPGPPGGTILEVGSARAAGLTARTLDRLVARKLTIDGAEITVLTLD
jgi:hypothetical protein